MVKQFLVFVLIFTGSVAFAQQHAIKGSVTTKQGEVLPHASVVLLQIKDSSLVASTATTSKGIFLLKDVRKGEYILKITFLGFAPYAKKISSPAENQTLQMGSIELQVLETELAEVTVLGERNAILVKEDTVEYHAGSFNTRPNANVEQLLKRLPGLELQRDGNIKVQGEAVTRIFVDGKEFFGGNLQMATKNLPADAIEKVEVIDGKSEESQFSGIDDGRREKVINLTLKEERKNMGFGKATAGMGTDNRYVGQANYNRFSENHQLSLMGLSNNINIQSLGGDGLGGEGSMPADFNQPGLQTIHAGGAHLFQQLSPKTSLIASYQLNHTNATLRENLVRQNFLPQGTALYHENSLQQNMNRGHQLHITLENKGSRNTLRLNTVVNYADIHSAATNSRQSFSVEDSLVNSGERQSRLVNNNVSLMAQMFYGHHFKKKGRLFTLKNQLSTYQKNSEGWSDSFTRFRGGAEEEVLQQNEQENKNLNYSLRFAYTEPLGKGQYLQANYHISNRRSRSELEVWDVFNENRQLNIEQSSHFRNTYLNQQAGLNYRLNAKKYKLSLGANVQQATLGRSLYPYSVQEKQSFRNLLPNATINRQFSRNTRLSLTYTTFVREPTINQLQPVLSRFDPLHQYVGNPGLRPEYRHQGKVSFNTSRTPSGIFFSTSFTYNYTNNPIIAAVQVDEQQVRTTQYVNLQESNHFAAFMSMGIPVKKLNSQLNISPYLRQEQSMNLLNGVEGAIRQRSLGGDLDWAYSYKELLDIHLRSSINATRSEYELNEQQDQFFVHSSFGAELAVQVFKNFWFTSDTYYNKFKNPGANFDQAIPVLNFSLSKLLLKDNKGEFKLSALNVLNRNLGVSQVASLNYIEQSVQNSLGNYYMLSFTFHLKGQQPEQE